MDAVLKLLIWFLLFAGYSAPVVPVTTAPAPPIKEVFMEEPFVLHVGQMAAVNEGSLTITFDGVVEDSRCPKDVFCAWSGRAMAALSVGAADKEAQMVEVGGFTDDDGSLQPQGQISASAGVAGYTVELLAVTPYPAKADAPPAGKEYQVQLVVSEGDAAP